MEDFYPGMSLLIDGERYTFLPGKWLQYQIGRYAKVYYMQKDAPKQGNPLYALKVFFGPDESIRKRTYGIRDGTQALKGIYDYRIVPGMAVGDRKVINTSQHRTLIRQLPSLENSVLMPWIRGKSWVNVVGNEKPTPILPEQSLRLARALSLVLAKLEQEHLAHCDIGGDNFVFSADFGSVELVDIEDLYSPDIKTMYRKQYLTGPEPKPKGTNGYAPKWVVTDGYWGPDADRFAAGILITEILYCQFPDFHLNRAGETLFLSQFFGKNSRGFRQIRERLAQMRTDGNVDVEKLLDLLTRVWFSQSLEDCPPIAEWKTALQPQITKDPDGGPFINAILLVSPAMLDFGSQQTAKLIVSKEGNGSLSGKITLEPWLEANRSLNFELSDSSRSAVYELTLRRIPPPPPPIMGNVQWMPKALVIESNGGQKVVGAKYKVRR